jgi:hypothetical protein
VKDNNSYICIQNLQIIYEDKVKQIKYLVILFSIFFITTMNAQDKGTGLGIIVGEPTGFSFKHWLSSNSAIDAAIAWSFIDEGAFHIHADYLLHSFRLINVPEGKLPFYYGIGGRLKTAHDAQLGVRVPLGLAYIFQSAPVDIFLEVVPILDFIPKTDFKINAALGARYYFQ